MSENIDYNKLRLDVLEKMIHSRGIDCKIKKDVMIKMLKLYDEGKYEEPVNETKYEKSDGGFNIGIDIKNQPDLIQIGKLVEKKPSDLTDNILVSSSGDNDSITFVQELEPFNDEYVYDIGINQEQPWFFANGILVHNSAYFSAYPVMKDLPEFQDFEWSKENVTDLYDKIGDLTNQSFPDFMQQAFNCTPDNGAIIRAARELCAIKGLFITKKRYAVLIYDKEGKRKDVNGKRGEIKAMGLDLKRSDTPKIVQEFLSDVLTDVLTGSDEQSVQTKVLAFRKEFRSWPGWLKGSPKRANKITHYQNVMEGNKKATIPGHVLASINWNRLKRIYNDNYSMPIQDGFKVVVCKLRPNPSGMTSVAYPVDELTLPQWFKELPFDDEAMEAALIDKKIENLLGVLEWKSLSEQDANNFTDLFSF